MSHSSTQEDSCPPVPAQRLLLYVEDNAANLELVELIVGRRADLALISAVAGHPGIALARERLPEVILMDIHLNDISGFEALKLLKTDPVTADIPVIALSSDAFPRQIEKGLEAGFHRYLTKPFRIDDFLNQLNETLDYVARRRQENALA